MRKAFFVVLIMVVILILSSSLSAQEKNPEEVLNAFADSLNAGDLNATIAFFADYSVVKILFGDLFPLEFYNSSAEIQDFVRDLIAIHFKIEIEILQMLGDIAVTRSKTWSDETIQLGIAPLEMIEIYPIRDGKFKGFMSMLTDESLTKLKNALASQ